MVWPAVRRAVTRALLKLQVAAADEIVVADERLAALGQHHRVIGGEPHDHDVVVPDRDVFDLADFHAGDAYEVARFQPADVGELGVVGLLRLKPQLAEYREQTEHHELQTTTKMASRHNAPMVLSLIGAASLNGC